MSEFYYLDQALKEMEQKFLEARGAPEETRELFKGVLKDPRVKMEQYLYWVKVIINNEFSKEEIDDFFHKSDMDFRKELDVNPMESEISKQMKLSLFKISRRPQSTQEFEDELIEFQNISEKIGAYNPKTDDFSQHCTDTGIQEITFKNIKNAYFNALRFILLEDDENGLYS